LEKAYLAEQDKILGKQKELLRQDYELQKADFKAHEKKQWRH
jgi:hypothetical protein